MVPSTPMLLGATDKCSTGTVKLGDLAATYPSLRQRSACPSRPCSLIRSQLNSLRARAPASSVIQGRHKVLRGTTTLAAVSTAGGTAASVFSAAPLDICSLITSVGVFLLCSAAALVLVCLVPVLLNAANAVRRTAGILKVVEHELPETIAAVRLVTLELSDCLAEMSTLSADVTSGVRATANLAVKTQRTVTQGATAVETAVKGIKPLLARTEQAAREALEAELLARSNMQYTRDFLKGVALLGREGVQRAKYGFAFASAGLLTVSVFNQYAKGLIARSRPRLANLPTNRRA